MNPFTSPSTSETDVYGIIVERPGEDPILLEAEAGAAMTLRGAMDTARKFGATRYAIVRLTFERGNRLCFYDAARLAGMSAEADGVARPLAKEETDR